jgi:hypothetical protein
VIKIRGPFATRPEAQAWVDGVAHQGVPFLEFTERNRPATGIGARLRKAQSAVAFAIYDDPAAHWPDEEIVLDPVRSWIVSHPR